MIFELEKIWPKLVLAKIWNGNGSTKQNSFSSFNK